MVRASYAPSSHPVGRGGVIAGVATGSPAERAGLQAGWTVVSADGLELRDVVDWQWATDGETVTLGLRSPDGGTRSLAVSRAPGESWGVEFTEALFDGVRTCRNRCAFCFMEQLPAGLRRALYLRDDDYRLSFLQGNFISLTNLADEDVARIVSQRLSPLYVSVHAVTPAVREKLVCAKEDRALERLDELTASRIDIHAQIVLVPGVNDGAELEATLTWLAAREGVVSVGVVPVGYTRFQKRFSTSYESAERAAGVIGQLRPWQEAFRERDGMGWVYLADEFYLSAGVSLPPAEAYDGFPQFENGIGIARTLIDEFSQAAGQAREAVVRAGSLGRQGVVVTGALAGPVFRELLSECEVGLGVLEVPNDFFGGNVSVAGLLTGEDVVRAIREDDARRRGSVYFVPDVVFNSDGVTLDDLSGRDIATASGAAVRVLSCDAAGLLDGVEGLAASVPPEPFRE